MQYIRPPQVAGYFYPSNPDDLRDQINHLLSSSKSVYTAKNIFGIVVPHAGYTYSGFTAAHAYNYIRGSKFKRVIIISPSHSEYFPGVSIFDGDAYETPLGLLEVDKEFVEKLTNGSKNIFRGFEGHRREHALEVQLPFLQIVLDKFKIVPIVIGDQGKIFVDELANSLAKVVDDETLIVASSDLSHHHTKKEANALDCVVEKRINNFEFENLFDDLQHQKCEACGGGPIVALMKAAQLNNFDKAKVLYRCDSGNITGDHREVVGYLSAVVHKN